MWLANQLRTSKLSSVSVLVLGLVVLYLLLGPVGGPGASEVGADESGADATQPGDAASPGGWSEADGIKARVLTQAAYRHPQSRRLLLEVELEVVNTGDFIHRMPRQWFDLTLPNGGILEAEQLLQSDAIGRLVIEPDQEVTVRVVFWLGPSGVLPDGVFQVGVHEAAPDSLVLELNAIDLPKAR